MSKKEMVLVHPTAQINALFPKEGFALGQDLAPNFADIQALEAQLVDGLSIQRREAVEENSSYRHFLPYVQLMRVNPEGKLEVFAYQRVKGVGEERLLGRHSIGLGGHINVSHCQFYDGHTNLNLGMTIMYNVMEELCEELSYENVPFMQAMLDRNIRSQPNIYGYLNDNSDKVGQRHLGVTMLMMVPYGYDPICTEESMVTVGFVELETLRANLDQYSFENWSRLIIEGLPAEFTNDLIEAGKRAAEEFRVFEAEQAEALKGLVAVGGIEGVQSEGLVKEGFQLDDVDNRVIAEVALDPSEETCSAECQADRL